MSEERPGIAIIDPLGAHGGHHFYVDNQANALAQFYPRVTVYHSRASRLDDAQYLSVPLFEGIYDNSASVIFRAGILARDLARAIVGARRRANVAIFHIFKSSFEEYLPICVARACGMTTVSIVHDVERIDRHAGRGSIASIAAVSDVLVVHNLTARDLVAARLRSARKIHVIPHGNYLSQYPIRPDKAESRAKLGLEVSPFTLLFFGNPRRLKGLRVLLEAIAQLKSRQSVRLVVAGKMSSTDLAEHKAFVAANGLSGNVRFASHHIPDRELPLYFGAADLVVLPYIKVYESGVALMASTLGRPVLASDLEPFREFFGDGERGLLFTSENPAALAAQISDCLDGRVDLVRLAERARSFALSERSWARTGFMLFEVIEASRQMSKHWP